MPIYDDPSFPPAVLTPGRPVTLWDGESISANDPSGASASVSVSLHRHEKEANCLSVEITFADDPGSFEVELQTADTDDNDHYVKKTSITAVNASNVARIEANNVVAKFARLWLKSLGNSVDISAVMY